MGKFNSFSEAKRPPFPEFASIKPIKLSLFDSVECFFDSHVIANTQAIEEGIIRAGKKMLSGDDLNKIESDVPDLDSKQLRRHL